MTEDVARDVTGSRGDFGWVALQKLVNVNGVRTPVTSSSLRWSFYSVTEGLTEGGAALGTRPRESGAVDVTRPTGGLGWTLMKEAVNENRV